MHSRLHKKTLSKAKLPYEGTFKTLTARVVGVYASDSVGSLTHPDTSIHSHLIFSNDEGNELTAHLEQFSIAEGTKLFLPKKLKVSR